MPVIVCVKAVADFHFRGQNVRAGELVAMRAEQALVEHRAGHVSLTRPAREPAPARAPSLPAAELHGRELRAEAAEATEAAEAAESPAPRRKYRRRDLQPEP
jgi:hypothetical protein